MYIPNLFQFQSDQEKIDFIKKYSFATIVTYNGRIPIATQLPFYVDDSTDKLMLSSHFSIANEQVNFIEQYESLVIFSEPHAYISPTHYNKIENVPTWDYIAVHAYGKAKIVKDPVLKIESLESMIQFYEKDYMEQWESLPEKYKLGMSRGIVAFDIEVVDLQGQKKLSQNKSDVERNKIVDHLVKSDQSVEKDLATYIKNV